MSLEKQASTFASLRRIRRVAWKEVLVEVWAEGDAVGSTGRVKAPESPPLATRAGPVSVPGGDRGGPPRGRGARGAAGVRLGAPARPPDPAPKCLRHRSRRGDKKGGAPRVALAVGRPRCRQSEDLPDRLPEFRTSILSSSTRQLSMSSYGRRDIFCMKQAPLVLYTPCFPVLVLLSVSCTAAGHRA